MELIANKPLAFARKPLIQPGDRFEIDEWSGQKLIRENKAYRPEHIRPVPNPGLVSCIMPTRNRRAFIPRALECWKAQTYQNLELIIIDNGEPVLDLIPADPRIKYMRMGAGMKLGALRNFACQMATGEFIAHWDDDDWYAPDRIENQLASLGDADVIAVSDCYFSHDPQPYLCTCERNRGIGSSLLYRRAYWQNHRFDTRLHTGEDEAFMTVAGHRMTRISGKELVVASIHPDNTCARELKAQNWRKAKAEDLPKGFK